jgi:hypothetical protein
MWNTKKYAAMAVVGAGLAFAATPASACGVFGFARVVSYGGCGAYGYAMYHRPIYGYAHAAWRPWYHYRPFAYASFFPMHRFYRPVYASAGYFPMRRFYRPVYASAGYFPRVYRPVFAAYRPVFAFRPVFAMYRPFYRPMAFGCRC